MILYDPQITRRLCPGFGRAHGTQQWDYTQGNQGHNQQCRHGIKEVGNRLNKNRQALTLSRDPILLEEAGEVRSPARQGNE